MDIYWFIAVLKGSVSSVLLIVAIVIPLMVGIEFFKHWNLISKVSPLFRPVLKLLKLPQEAVFPLLAGLFFGLVYGAGIIIQSSREGVLTKRDLFVIVLFLVICHSLLEDTMLFVAVGANFWFVLIVRFILAVMITYSWVLFDERKRRRKNEGSLK